MNVTGGSAEDINVKVSKARKAFGELKKYGLDSNLKLNKTENLSIMCYCHALWLQNLVTEIRIPVPWGYVAGRWYGDDLKQPILALHGWLDNCGTFAKLAPMLVPYRSILCIDFPGHGLSSHLPQGMQYHIKDYVHLITRIMKIYNWDKITLMGHSMGGYTAFYFTCLYPDRVDGLICLDVLRASIYSPEEMIPYMHYVIEKAVIGTKEKHPILEKIEPRSYTFEEFEQRLYEGSLRSIWLENCKYILERNLSKSKLNSNKYYLSRDIRVSYMHPFEFSEEMNREMAMRICNISLPLLRYIADNSSYILPNPTEIDEILKANNPNFFTFTICGGTHHMHLNNPEEVAKIIIEFLKKYFTHKGKL
ncbi:probable serine hydrolase [Teleopsis dalmanni]|uniref:probable serine hydrolase n=1 Tax=Teleopsis dalmanni TaxID=139649 RepID=UPI0018CD7177|nr:probable serine hydrolase [Teleopsis dalmanni]